MVLFHRFNKIFSYDDIFIGRYYGIVLLFDKIIYLYFCAGVLAISGIS